MTEYEKTLWEKFPDPWDRHAAYEFLDKILEDFEVFPQECLFVGDSLAKDGMVAASRGIQFIWAHYGTSLPAEYEEMVNRSLKPPIQDKFHRTLPQELITAVAARYDEILNFVV